MFRNSFHARAALPPATGRLRAVRLLPCAVALAAALVPAAAAQQQPQDSKDKQIEQLLKELAAERAAREALEHRVSQLEAGKGAPSTDDLERQLQGLVAPGDLQPAPTRPPSSAAFYNPAIGVIMDSVAEAGNYHQRLGEEANTFKLREAEIDMRLPLSPFAEGVGVFSFENEGGNSFNANIEEGYANVNLAGLLDNSWDTTVKIGRFRPLFGRTNQLHAHDWLQTEMPLPIRNLLGDEGVNGDGVLIHQPLASWQSATALGRTVNLDLALMNSDTLAGEGTALSTAADNAGTALTSQGPMYVAHLSQYSELDSLSDLEVGLSAIGPLGNDPMETAAGQQVKANYVDADITWRNREAEHGVGSWLVQAEGLKAQIDDNGAGVVANSENSGWWLTVQRQTAPNVYWGIIYGTSDVLTSSATQTSISPYVTWYADEFFRIRAELEHLTQDGHGTADNFSDANRAQLQFTWNFGVHAPHPYWVNK